MGYEKCKFSVDWLNMTVDLDPDLFFGYMYRTFGLEFERIPGMRFCEFASRCINLSGGAFLCYWNQESDGSLKQKDGSSLPYWFHVSVSGDALRYIETCSSSSVEIFLRYLMAHDHDASRVDMACDFFDPDNRIVPLLELFAYSIATGVPFKSHFRCGIKFRDSIFKSDPHTDDFTGEHYYNLTIGKKNSKKGQLQLYNKLCEVRQGRLNPVSEEYIRQSGATDYWWRLEYRIFGRANEVLKAMIDENHCDPLSGFREACFIFGDFMSAHYGRENITNCPIEPDWQDFKDWLESASSIDFVELVQTPYVRQSIEKTFSYLEHVSVWVHKIGLLAMIDPIRYQRIFDEGAHKLNTISRYRPWIDDFVSFGQKDQSG